HKYHYPVIPNHLSKSTSHRKQHYFPTRRSSDLQKEEKIEVKIANSLWLNDAFSFNDDFSKTMNDYFAAEVDIIDVHDPSSAKRIDRKSTRLNSSHVKNSYAVFCLKKKTKE